MRFLEETPIVAAVLLVCALVTGQPAAAAGAAELCPVADNRQNRSVSYRNNVVSAAVTADDTAALMASLKSGTGEARTVAIMRLALGGDLNAFRVLLANADVDGVYIYANSYLNRDGTVCIDPELERALRDRLFEPGLGHRLTALLGQNTYRHRRTLQALRAVPFDRTDARKANQYLAFGRAMTATRLPNVEADVLAHARSLLPLETPIEKSTLTGLHQHYARFFTDRGYAPAVAYFRELLVQADREEPVQSFRIKYGMLRTVVQRGLVALDDAGGDDAIVGELEAIAGKPLDPFSMSELQNINQLLPSLTNLNARNAVVAVLLRLLRRAQPARYEYPMRRSVYRTLAALDTAGSKALLVAELGRYVSDAPPPARDAAMPVLFQALTDVTDLDIAAVVALVDDQWAPATRRRVWTLAGVHPSDAGVDFLLAELRLSLSGAAEVEQVLGADATTVLLKLLTVLPAPAYQRRARAGIDALFEQGMLLERDYMTTAAVLNKALGDESPRYVVFREERARRRAAERARQQQAAATQARREMQAAFAEELARHSSAEGIAENIALLASGGREGRRRGAQWLIIVGEPALPQLHAALAAPATTSEQRFPIMTVLGEIGSPRSVTPLIRAAETWGDGGLYRPALFALALLPPTDAAIAFAHAQLADGVGERRRIAGLVYLARIRHQPATALVSRFTKETLPLRTRSAGWYLGARLGVPGVAASVAAALQQTTDRSELEALQHSLAEAAASAEAFKRIAHSAGFTDQSYSYRQSLAYCRFRTAPDRQKVELAYQVLGDGGTWHRREAIRYLIALDPQGTVDKMTGGVGQWLPLHMLLPQSAGLQLLFSESRRMGYTLRQTDRGYALTRI